MKALATTTVRWSALALGLGACFSPCASATEFTPLPGKSSEISRALSASRDANTFTWQYNPRQVRRAGVDVGIAGWRFSVATLRLGFFGMIELSGDDDDDRAILDSGQAIDIWRAGYGMSLALSLDAAARRWFGPRGAFELGLRVRHESSHITGAEEGDTEPKYETVPNMGDFLMPEVALRLPIGPLSLSARAQHKLFVNRDDTGYTHGPGGELVLRWPLSPSLHVFASAFGEYLFGGDVRLYGHRAGVPDAYFVRQLAGVVLPGFAGDVQLFTSLRVGHGKGKLAFREELLWGWGARLDLVSALNLPSW